MSEACMCKNYSKCSAPLCPMDSKSLTNGIWYPDEEICRNLEERANIRATGVDWVARQNKIKRKCRDIYRFFTHQMLQINFIIRSGIKGIDPDGNHSEGEWLKKHPEKRIFSQEEKAVFLRRVRKVKMGEKQPEKKSRPYRDSEKKKMPRQGFPALKPQK